MAGARQSELVGSARAVMECAVSGHNMIILGQAGTGKTSLINNIFTKLTKIGRKVKMTATTGLASSLLPKGQTIHRLTGIQDGRFLNREVLERAAESDVSCVLYIIK